MLLKHIYRLFIPLILFLCPAVLMAQNNIPTTDKEKQSVVKINKLDVIDQQDDEYTGIVIDQKHNANDDDNYFYERPFIVAPPPMEDVDEQPKVFLPVDDEGVESESDIIYASFDEETIHYPKLDVSTLTEPVHVDLVNPARGEHFAFPTPTSARLTSHFGPRRRRFHYGIDLAQPTGEPIYAAFDGTVRISKYNRSYGNLVVIRHTNGLETYYAHLSRRDVIPGDQVKAGEVIGLCGNTGHSYGSHLHFEIRYMGNAMNPENVIDCANHTLIDDELELTAASFRKVAKQSASNKKGNSSKGNQYYKVRSGDTLTKIAKRNGTTVKKLCKLNGISENKTLSIGKRLRVR